MTTAAATQAAFRPCALIPIYNHLHTIAATVAALHGYGLFVLIVDDGSNAATAAVLDAIAQDSERVHLIRLAQNGGKGRALSAGLQAAQALGFSHALQIDADGQHQPADVPRFLAAGQACPAALICGQPVYDDSVPRARLYGRYVTHVCVWLETLSFTLRDSDRKST